MGDGKARGLGNREFRDSPPSSPEDLSLSEPLERATAARWVATGLIVVLSLAAAVFVLFRTPPEPPPMEIADDPLLVAGRAVYFDRCISCHGLSGRGDGPIAKGLAGPRVGDLTDATWKHGDQPEQVRAVIAQGVPNSAMAGWGKTLGPDGVMAASAYVYYLAGRPVPESLRDAFTPRDAPPRRPRSRSKPRHQ